MNNELKHYGVIGMKWGIRRYQNYSGSYTKAGMKRYNAAKDVYDEKKAKYKETKEARKRGEVDKYAVKKARNEYKQSESELKKHYRHLKLDKLGDEGKLQYAEGRRITSNADIRKLISTGGGLATVILANQGDYMTAGKVAAGTAAAEVALRIIEEHSNRRLRAYYAHTSNY